MEFKTLTVPQDRYHKSCWSSNSNRDINVVSLDNLISVNDRVDNRILLKGKGCRLDEERHES